MAARSKLAVILHADIVGSTALVREDERVAHERIQDTFRQFSDTISTYEGITHELRGDALLAEFTRASDAVAASLAFQALNANRNAMLDDDIRPEVRVGISLASAAKLPDRSVTWGCGIDGIVPLAVERVWFDVHACELVIGDSPTLGINALIDTALDEQAGLGCGGADKVHDDLMGQQRLTAPVLGDERE